jgi:hypothetical protein
MDELSMNIQYRSTFKIIYEMCLLFCQDCMCVPAETIKTGQGRYKGGCRGYLLRRWSRPKEKNKISDVLLNNSILCYINTDLFVDIEDEKN